VTKLQIVEKSGELLHIFRLCSFAMLELASGKRICHGSVHAVIGGRFLEGHRIMPHYEIFD
jgi:hypothetical protein